MSIKEMLSLVFAPANAGFQIGKTLTGYSRSFADRIVYMVYVCLIVIWNLVAVLVAFLVLGKMAALQLLCVSLLVTLVSIVIGFVVYRRKAPAKQKLVW